MKKHQSLGLAGWARLMVFAVFMCICGTIAAADTYIAENVLTYELDADNSTATVTGDTLTTSHEVVIPESVTVDGTTYKVTAIGDSAFMAKDSITKVTMPNCITSIGKCAFAKCTKLTDMNLSSGITELGTAAFWLCSLWVAEVEIPEAITEVPESLFLQCRALTSITLNDKITSIGKYAFYYCNSWTGTLTIPSGVTEIPTQTFRYCTALDTINLHDNITTIGERAFSNCQSWAGTLALPKNLSTLGNIAFEYCSSLTGIDLSPATQLTYLPASTFQYCTGLTSVTIPENIDSIGTSVFINCTSIESVDLSDSLRAIGVQAFRGCSALVNIEIPANVELIKYSAFYACTSLEKIDILGPVTTIENQAFYKCAAVKKVYLRGQITNDDYYDFYFGANSTSGSQSTTDVYAYMQYPPTRTSISAKASWEPYALASATLHVPSGCAENFSGSTYNKYWQFTNISEDLVLVEDGVDELEYTGYDWNKIVLGTDTFPAGYVTTYFYYDAEESGTLVLTGTQVPLPAYKDISFMEVVDDYSSSYASDGSKVVSFTVEAGKRYYFKTIGASSTATTYTVKLQNADALPQLESISKEEYSTLNVTGSTTVAAYFDMDVDVEKATISYKETSTKLEVIQTYKTMMSVDYSTALYDMLSNKEVSEGDTITITFSGIAADADATKLYNETGVLELKYKAPAMPVSITAEVLPETFLSYWESGDEAGKVVIEFNDSLYSGDNEDYQAAARLMYGRSENSDYYVEDATVTISGNTLTIDFSGKQRNRAAMSSTTLYYMDEFGAVSSDSLRPMTLKVYNVYGTDGQAAYTGVQGNVGSYTYTFPYEEVLAWQFDPEDGSTIAGVDTLKIAVENIEVLSYRGVAMGYTYQNETYNDTIAVADIISVADADSLTTTLKVLVPTSAKSAIDVTASLIDASSLYADTLDISASYDALNFTMIYPTAESIDTIHAGEYIEVSTGIDSRIAYMFYIIRNTTTDKQVVTRSTMTYDETSGTWKAEAIYDQVFKIDNNYQIEFYMYSDEDSFDSSDYLKSILAYSEFAFAGAGLPYEYSKYEFDYASPENGTYLETAEDQTFTYAYTGPVNINSTTSFGLFSTNVTMPFRTLTPGDDAVTAQNGKQYSKTWTVTFNPDSLLMLKGAPLQVSIAVEDSLGQRVKGELGEESQTYTIFSYANDFGIEDLDFTPERGSMVYQLDTLYATFSEGINVSWLVSFDDLTLVNDETGETVATVQKSDDQYFYLVIPDEYAADYSYVPTSIRLPLTDTITATGSYSLIIPRQAFILGQDDGAFYYKKDTVKWEIVDELAYTLEPDSISPAALSADEADSDDAATVKELGTITLTYSEAVYLTADTIIVTDNISNYTAKLAVSEDDSTVVTITLDEPLTAASTLYEVIIPAGTIVNEKAYTSSLFTGLANPATTLYYLTADPDQLLAGNVSITPEEGTVDTLYQFVLSFDDYTETWVGKRDTAEEGPYLLDAAGNKVATGTIKDNYSEMYKSTITLSSAVTAAGDYTLVILPGTYWLGGMSSWESNGDTLSFAYTVVPPATATITISAVDPIDEDTVTRVYEMYFSVDADEVYVNEDKLGDITIYNKTSGTTYTASEIWKVKGSANEFGVAVAEDITEEGWLTVSMPEGIVGDLNAYNSGFTTGNVNIAAAFYYYISTEEEEAGNGTVTIDPAEGTVESLSTFTITFEDHTQIAATWWYYPSLLDANGDVVYKWTFDGDYEIPYDWSTWTGSNYVTLTLPEAVTAAGTYTLVVPDSVFNFDENSENVNAAIEFVYTIDESTNINGIDATTADDDAPTYNLGGQRVNATTKGILIRRGKKFVNK